MNYRVTVLARATDDVDEIYAWIAKRSPQGTLHWNNAFLEATKLLATDPHSHSLAPESRILQREIRELHFKTRAGRRYRLLFAVAGEEVRILSVRGPGEPPVTDADL